MLDPRSSTTTLVKALGTVILVAFLARLIWAVLQPLLPALIALLTLVGVAHVLLSRRGGW